MKYKKIYMPSFFFLKKMQQPAVAIKIIFFATFKNKEYS